MASSSVQFKGIEGVCDAYENRNVIAWSLWQGKQFMFKYEGSDIGEGAQNLRDTLQLLSESSNAIYTLKVYEDGGKIKSNTPDDGSFNFKLNSEGQEITNSQYTSYKNSNEIAERLARIEAKLLQEEQYEEDEPESRLGLIGEIISHPTLQPIVQSFLSSLIGIGKNVGASASPQMQRVSISGINDDATLMAAITELKNHDTHLAEHLTKLATIAKESPDSFKFLLSTLDAM